MARTIPTCFKILNGPGQVFRFSASHCQDLTLAKFRRRPWKAATPYFILLETTTTERFHNRYFLGRADGSGDGPDCIGQEKSPSLMKYLKESLICRY